jgi:uncharacterized protein (DUF433 family)
LGRFVVSAPAVCRGRPTFKYTRIEVAGVLERLAAGHAVEALIADSQGRLSHEAIAEAALLGGARIGPAGARRRPCGMIILDEQLLSYGIRDPMARWYRGQAVAITQLRPQTVMRDDAIPMLLRAARRPTFVTIN